MVYPFGLWARCRYQIGLVLTVVGGSVRQIDLHVIRHFFEKIGWNQATMSIKLTLKDKKQNTIVLQAQNKAA